jgi:hypothetical protein
VSKADQALLRPEVAAKYVVTIRPCRLAVRALGYREIDLRTLSLAEADELVASGGFEYLKLKRKRRSTASGATLDKRGA